MFQNTLSTSGRKAKYLHGDTEGLNSSPSSGTGYFSSLGQIRLSHSLGSHCEKPIIFHFQQHLSVHSSLMGTDCFPLCVDAALNRKELEILKLWLSAAGGRVEICLGISFTHFRIYRLPERFSLPRLAPTGHCDVYHILAFSFSCRNVRWLDSCICLYSYKRLNRGIHCKLREQIERFIQKAQQLLVWCMFSLSHLPFFAQDKDIKQNAAFEESPMCVQQHSGEMYPLKKKKKCCINACAREESNSIQEWRR